VKLNVNAKEFLALYNLLHQRIEIDDDRQYEGDEVQLHQIYGRMKSCLISSLSSDKHEDVFGTWFTQEKAKIDKLNEQLGNVKKEQADLKKSTSTSADVGELIEDDYVRPEYPRRGTGQNRGGRHNNKKR